MTLAFITGINGFIGSKIAEILVDGGLRVRGLVRGTSNLANLERFRSKIELIEGDIRDASVLRKAMNGVDVCYHAAALARVGRFKTDDYFSNNLTGTINVCAEALRAKVKRFIYTSTCETLRTTGCRKIITEGVKNYLSDMISDYSRSKFLAEEHVRSVCREGLPAVILNPTAVMGPGDINVTPPGHLVRSYCRGRVPLYFETGFNVVDARDVARAHILAAERGETGRRYIIGGDNVMLSHLFHLIRQLSGKRPISIKLPYSIFAGGAIFLPKNSVLAKRIKLFRDPFFFSSGEAKKALGFEAQIDLRSMLEETL